MRSYPKNAIILGSARSDGNTRKIVQHLLTHLPATVFDLHDYQIAPYNYDHQYPPGDNYITLIEELLPHQHLIVATPIYWYAMSASMKTFFDRITDLLKVRKDLGRQLNGKSLGVLACSSNQEEYPEFWIPFQRSADYLDMKYLGHVHTWIENGEVPLILHPALQSFSETLK